MVEQWSGDFLQRTEMCSSPIIRTRILSYLYYTLQRFNMHIVVKLIPLLIHLSLLLFFAGLVGFLRPINTLISAVAIILLAMISSAYLWRDHNPPHHLLRLYISNSLFFNSLADSPGSSREFGVAVPA
ncbi:hypothetical protein C8R43DRAFT_163098 [Mycena crocata]|nr:hypothetical protein C8R43DRAFT_163098 [Mycena crocata]